MLAGCGGPSTSSGAPLLWSVTEEGCTASIDLCTGERLDDVGTTGHGFVTHTQVSADPTTTSTLTGPDGVPFPVEPGRADAVDPLGAVHVRRLTACHYGSHTMATGG